MFLRISILLTALAATAVAKCPPKPGQVELGDDEFTVEGYDAQARVLALRTVRVVRARPGHHGDLRLAALDRPHVMPMTPEQMARVMEAHQTGALRFVMDVRPAPGPRAPDDCGHYVPSPKALAAGEETIAEMGPPAPEPTPAAPATPEPAQVSIGPVRFARGAPRFRTKGLQRHVAAVARHCLHKGVTQGGSGTGAVVLELRTTPAGLPMMPNRVVDGLVNRTISECLIDRLFERSATWHDAPAAARVFVPIYFRPAPSVGGAAEARGENAP